MAAEDDSERILAQLAAHREAIGVPRAEAQVPTLPGLYAIYLDRADVLRSLFGNELKRRKSSLLYVGMASKSLHKRLVMQDLRHKKGPSTFFRGIGAILGYRPPCGSLRGNANQNNYRFSRKDTGVIIRWIDTHIRLRWCAIDSAGLVELEAALIQRMLPLINDTHNPLAMVELCDLRAKCRKIAQGKGKKDR